LTFVAGKKGQGGDEGNLMCIAQKKKITKETNQTNS